MVLSVALTFFLPWADISFPILSYNFLHIILVPSWTSIPGCLSYLFSNRTHCFSCYLLLPLLSSFHILVRCNRSLRNSISPPVFLSLPLAELLLCSLLLILFLYLSLHVVLSSLTIFSCKCSTRWFSLTKHLPPSHKKHRHTCFLFNYPLLYAYQCFFPAWSQLSFHAFGSIFATVQ